MDDGFSGTQSVGSTGFSLRADSHAMDRRRDDHRLLTID